MVESLTLFGVGAVAGIGLVYGLQQVLLATNPTLLPRLSEVSVNARVLLFALGTSLATAIVFGALPLLHAVSPDITALLRHAHRGLIGSKRAHRLRGGLITAQIAVAVLLLVGAGLMTRTLLRLGEVDLGFEPAHATTFEVSVPATKYKREESPRVLGELIERIQTLPGVEAAGAINVVPLAPTGFTWGIQIERQPVPAGMGSPRVDYRVVTPGVFPAMQMALTRGRLFSESDAAESPSVAIVNEAMVRRFWPDEDPIGHRIRIEGPPIRWFEWATIVGVVGDMRGASVDAAPAPAIYRPVAQHPYMDMAVGVRTANDVTPGPTVIRSQARAVDADLTLHNFQDLDAFIRARLC